MCEIAEFAPACAGRLSILFAPKSHPARFPFSRPTKRKAGVASCMLVAFAARGISAAITSDLWSGATVHALTVVSREQVKKIYYPLKVVYSISVILSKCAPFYKMFPPALKISIP
jgi:hypothetical protein